MARRQVLSQLLALGLGAGSIVGLAVYGSLRSSATTGEGDSGIHDAATSDAGNPEQEPNDRPENAAIMPDVEPAPGDIVRKRIHGRWSHATDVDCYSVPLHVPPNGAVLAIELTPPSGGAARLSVLDSGDRDLGVPPRTLIERSGTVGERLLVPALGARSWEPRYFVCVSPSGAPGNETYTLEVATRGLTEPFEFEPNDTAATASALPDGAVISGYLSGFEEDWFRTAALGRGRVRFQAPEAVEVELTAHGADRAVIARASGHGTLDLEVNDPSYVRVRVLSSAIANAAYRLRVDRTKK